MLLGELPLECCKVPFIAMLRPPDPTNFLACREHYQVCKYRLQRTEEQLFKVFNCCKLSDLQVALDREAAKKNSAHHSIMRLYNTQHEELAAADDAFELAKTLQRSRIAMDKTFATLDC